MTEPVVKRKHPVAAHPWISAAIGVLVFGSIFCTLWVPIYASTTPKIGDFPFFYFYLIVYMPVVAIALWIVVLLQKRLGTDGSGTGTGIGEEAP
jgi:hypothetical protein